MADQARYQPFLPGIMRGGAKQLGRAILRAQRGPLPLEVVDRFERLLGRHLPPEVSLVFECPSCHMLARGRARGKPPTAGRGASTAARVARLIPRVPVRHWVLSLPRWMRARLAEDEGIAGSIARSFVRAITDWQRSRAAALSSIDDAQGGAVTVVQRGGSALNLDVHVHALVLDGVYEIDADGEPVFHPLPDPSPGDLAAISRRVRAAVGRKLATAARRRNSLAPLAPLREASVQHRVATGPRVDRSVARIRASTAGPPADGASASAGRSHAEGGLSIFAAPPLAGDERQGLARLARYLTRPPIDPSALEPAPGGKIRYRLKRPFADGTTHVEFSSQELMEKLVAMVPDGPSQRLAFHGVLAPAAAQRCKIVPGQLELIPRSPAARGGSSTSPRRPRRMKMADAGVPQCPDCAVDLRLVELEQATDWLVGS